MRRLLKNSVQLSGDEIVHGSESVVELERIGAAAHGGIRLAAALAAADGGDGADDIARADAGSDRRLAARCV